MSDRSTTIVSGNPAGDTATAEPTLVVGYDGSLPSKSALAYAAHRAGTCGRLVIVYSSAPRRSWFGVPSYHPTEQHSQSVLADIAADSLRGVSYTIEEREGPPAHALIDVAREYAADEVVIGTRGVRATGVGDVGLALLHGADRPVVVVPPAYRPPRRA